MNVSVTALYDLCSRSKSDDGSLLRTVMNSASSFETGFALGLLADELPQRSLVAALNLRELLFDIPEAPFVMPADFASLSKTAGLERRGNSWVKRLARQHDAPEIELLGQGNLCYDIAVRADGESSLLKPGPMGSDCIRPAALIIILANAGLLDAIVGLLHDMGLVLNPRFYLTIVDWQLEHTGKAVGDLDDLF